MDEIKQTVSRLRETMSQWLEPKTPGARPADAGAFVREQAVKLLKRKDLRITTETLLLDLRNAFTGFEAFDPENQRRAMEDAMRVVEKMETLIAVEKVLNPDRIELPDPPPFLGNQLKTNIERIRQEARAQKDRLQKEAQSQRLSRRPARTAAKAPTAVEPSAADKERRNLVFENKHNFDRRGDRRPRPPQRHGPEAAPAGPKPRPPSGPNPSNAANPPGAANPTIRLDDGGDKGNPNRHRRRHRKK